jgi:NAD(P)-dependent dehydrogenase (short-subunit alcohol dehydrogenase family)
VTVRGSGRGPLVVLTGATRGIGLAAATELARRGAELALVGRDPDRLAAAADAARKAGDQAPVHEHLADLIELDEVNRLAAEILDRYERIDVLALNAGAMFTSRRVTSDGFEQTLALNHLSPFLLTSLLLDRLRESAPARIVVTASIAHFSGHLDRDDPLGDASRSFSPMGTYCKTKLCNVLFTRELARRVEGSGVTANCFHPGAIRSGFGKNDGLAWRLFVTLGGPFLRSPAHGARSLVWLALSPDAAGLSGAYVVNESVRTPSAAARDDDLAAALWEATERALGVRTPAHA